MQERVITKGAKAYQKSAWAIRVIFLLAGLMIAGGGIWYVAVTGIIGRKKWDFVEYGMPPAILAAAGGVVLLAAIIAYFKMPCFSYKAAPLM